MQYKYADDTVILFPAKSVDEIDTELKGTGWYCNINELLLNLKVGKNESLLFGTDQRISGHGINLNIIYENNSNQLCHRICLSGESVGQPHVTF